MKVLVTGAGALLGQGIIRALRASTLSAEIIAVDPSPLAAGLYWADRAHLVPMANAPNYLPALRRILERERPDAVLVGTDVELPILSAHADALEDEHETFIVVSNPRVIEIANDKWRTFEFMRDHGFDHPRSCLPGDEERLIDEVGYPLIVKPRVGARSIGLQMVRDRETLRRAIAAVPNAVIQECVGTPETEYTAGTMTFGSDCASIVMRRDLRDGNTYRGFVEVYPELNEIVQRMALALQAFGPANFQFRLDGDKAKVFEINGRYSGTTPLRMHAGFNEVEIALRYLLLGEPLHQPTIHPRIILRHWSETVVESHELVAPQPETKLAGPHASFRMAPPVASSFESYSQ